MGNLFGIRRRAPVVTAQDRAILQLKQQRDKIRIYQRKTEADLEKNKELALKLFQNGLKDRALVVLRRKKNMEDILSRTDKQLETLEQLVTDIEYTQIEVSVVEGLKVGTEALKQLNSLMNIDDIQQMMEDSEEAAEKQREISDILQRSAERYDESDLLQELEFYKKQAQPPEPVEISKDVPIETPEVVAPKAEPETVVEEKLIDVEAGEQAIQSKIENLPDVPKHQPIELEEESPKHTKQKQTRQLEPSQ